MAKKPPPRKNHKDAGRKKKVSVLTTEKVEYIDYKDVNLLKRFVSDRAKVRARRVTGNDTQQQAEVCLLYTSPSPRDQRGSRMPSSA